MTPIGRVGVVVVNYGSSDLLERHLVPLIESDADLVAVVVDNYSSAVERRAVRQLSQTHEWDLLERPNLGFGAGANAGAAAAIDAGCSFLLLLNPDASISAASVRQLVRRLESDPLAIVAPTVRRVDGSIWFSGAWLELDRGRTRGQQPGPERGPASFWVSAACMITTADAWRRTGGFNENYFLYWEDVDLSERAQRAGIDLIVCKEIDAVHDEGGTQRSAKVSSLSWQYYFYNVRNRLVFGAIHLDDERWRRWLRSTPRETYQIMLRGGGHRIFLSPFRAAGTMLHGVASGLRMARQLRTTQSRDG